MMGRLRGTAHGMTSPQAGSKGLWKTCASCADAAMLCVELPVAGTPDRVRMRSADLASYCGM